MTRPALLRLVLVAGLVLLLEAACQSRAIPATVIIAPSAMLLSLLDILASGVFDRDILATLGDVGAATLLAVALGFAGGLALHALPRLRAAAEPLLASYYAIPTFAFYPLFIVFFGVGSGAIIAIAVLLAVVSMLVSTLNGLDRIPAVLRKTARIHRLKGPKAAWLILLPATAPYLFTGVKLTVAYAFIGVIASEFVLAGSGLGYQIAYAYNNFDNRTMYGLMLLVVIVVTTANALLGALDRRFQARLGR